MNKENKVLIEKARIRIKCSYCDESLYLSLYDLL